MPDVLVGLGRGAREARVDDDQLGAGFLGVQHVQHRDRVRLGGVRADVHRALGVAHVVVRVRHRAVAPRVRDARDRGGVADARLVVAVVAAPQAHPLAQQVGLLVVVLRRADDEDRVGAALLLELEHLGADLVQRLVPRDLLVLVADQLHRRLQAVVAVAVLAQGGALGAVRAEVDRRVEHRLLADPDAVLDHRVDGAADRAVRAHGAADDERLRRRPVRSAASAFFTSESCAVARPTPTPSPERRRNARRSIVGTARRTPRARLATRPDGATATPPAPPWGEIFRVNSMVVPPPLRCASFRSSDARGRSVDSLAPVARRSRPRPRPELRSQACAAGPPRRAAAPAATPAPRRDGGARCAGSWESGASIREVGTGEDFMTTTPDDTSLGDVSRRREAPATGGGLWWNLAVNRRICIRGNT